MNMASSSSTNKSREKPNISDFYDGTNVLITGATGFLGKVLLEKLLRSCGGINCIYLLIRPKKGIDVKQRLDSLLTGPVFENLKLNNPRSFEKVKAVCGDIGEENLGLSETDRKLLVDEINIVLHSAATVKFTEDISIAVTINVLGTKYVIELCEEAKQLKSFVYVSTAYSNPDKQDIQEIVYEPPRDPRVVMNCAKILPPDVLEENTKKLIGKHPNTYTFSKALAESIVAEHSTRFPIAIIRPSIVNASWKGPFPGWVDGLAGATGLIMQCALGTFTNFRIKNDVFADLIPVDVVVDTIITSAWHSTLSRSKALKVYNCVSSSINGITWGEIGELTQRYSREYPTQYLIRYPTYNATSNKMMYGFYNYMFNLAPAVCYDAFLYCTGSKPKMVRLWRKSTEHSEIVKFATCERRNVCTTTFQSLIEAVKEAEDSQNFTTDISKENGFDWNEYMRTYILGLRKHIFKENISNLHLAKVKLNRIYWFSKFIQLVWFLTVFTTGAVIRKRINDHHSKKLNKISLR